MEKIKIFVSYSHEDEVWVSATISGTYRLIPWLEKQLRSTAEIWTDHALKELPGEKYNQLITEEILDAGIALLLISQDFVSSEYIMGTELPLIKRQYDDEKIKIIPLLITNVSNDGKEKISWIFDLQTYPNDTKPLISFIKDAAEWSNVKVEILNGINNKIASLRKPKRDDSVQKEIRNIVLEDDQDSKYDEEFIGRKDGKIESVVDKALTEKETEKKTQITSNVAETDDKNSNDQSFEGDNGSFTDTRDGYVYKWVRIGSQIWMAENLAFNAGSGCWFYNHQSVNLEKYGFLYEWNTALNSIPAGWHLPCNEEWDVLENFLIENNYSSSELKKCIAKSLASTSDWSQLSFLSNSNNIGKDLVYNNRSNFNAKPGGLRSLYGSFNELTKQGWWWGSSEITYSKENACGRSLHYNNGRLLKFVGHKKSGYSVRCIKDRF